MDTHVQRCLWGEGRGWACMNLKMPQKCKSVQRVFFHDCRLREQMIQVFCKHLRPSQTASWV